jgi:hypothetical protein
MFTEKAMAIIERAKDRAFSLAREYVDLESMPAAMGTDTEAAVRLADCLIHGDTAALRGRCPEWGKPTPCPGKMEPDTDLRTVLGSALELASGEGVPDRTHPGFIGLEHLVCRVFFRLAPCGNAVGSHRKTCRRGGGFCAAGPVARGLRG